MISIWYVYVPGFVIVVAGVVAFRWLARLQTRAEEHGERIAALEARRE